MAVPVLISGALLGSRELITELGGKPADLARRARLPARVFDEPDIFVPAAGIVDFLELAAQSVACRTFALEHARRLPLGLRGLGIRGQGWMFMRAARNVREALHDFVGIYGLYTDAGTLRMQTQRGDLWLSYTFLPVGRWGEEQIIHLTLARMCLFIGESLARAWQPAAVELRSQPEDPAPYAAFFGPNVKFGQARDAILIDHETLTTPLQTHAADIAATSAGRGGQGLDGPALAAEVKAVLGTLLRHDDCSIEVVSGVLGFSVRTLQRRLAEAGTSFHDEIESVRADLAWRHVTRTALSFARISDLVGYDGQAAFSRAFRRWHGMTPRDARRTKV
jgi:AraC-like DNA-binding protein